MSHILRLCPKCSKNPATIQCIDCEEKMCYTCEDKIHKNSRNHRTDIIPYEQMKQIKSTKFIISAMKETLPNFDQQQELNELQAQIDAKTQFIKQQEDKWNYQINTLEEAYQKKLKQFEQKIEQTEQSFQQFSSNNQGLSMVEDIKKQMEVSKKKAWSELNTLKQKLSEKEQLLKEMIQKEQTCSKEISKKEQLINKYKDFIEKQQQERDLIKNENGKIKVQLEQIKTLFKAKLPELGMEAGFLDRIGKCKQENIYEENEDEEEQNENEEEQNEDEEEQVDDEEEQNDDIQNQQDDENDNQNNEDDVNSEKDVKESDQIEKKQQQQN